MKFNDNVCKLQCPTSLGINKSCDLKRAGIFTYSRKNIFRIRNACTCSLHGRSAQKSGPRNVVFMSNEARNGAGSARTTTAHVRYKVPKRRKREDGDFALFPSHPLLLEKAAHLRPSTIFMGASRESGQDLHGS